MITKPEDAVPGYCNNYNKAKRMFVGPTQKVFTAAECAEIATAYAESVGKYINALSPDMEREASDEMDKWQNRFIEWGWMK